MAEWRSQYCSTDNEYILFRIWVRETATNVIANTSTIRITVYAWRTNSYTTNYGGGCNVKIDGVARGYQYWNWNEKPVYYDSDTVLYDEENIVISHNSDGTKSINVQATCEWYSDGQIYIDSPYQGFDITLTSLDRVGASVSTSVSNIGVSGFTISATSNVNCDQWYYSLNGGTNYTWFSSTNGTSASVNVTGLSPNTTYNVIVSARKTSNQVWNTSNTVSAKTLGNAILNSVNTVTADNSTVSFSINATVYVPSYTHKLEIKNGSTSILTKTGLTLANGNNTITLTSSERTTLLNAMSTIKNFTGTFVLTTWSGSTQIGSATSKTATVQTTSANSAPTFTGFTYQDNNSAVVAVTGNDQVMVQNVSTVKIVATAATAKNGATIKSYSVSFGNLSTSSTSTTITMGTITTSGTVAMTVTAVDSRGYTTSRSVNVTVAAYSKIVYTSSTIRRVNEVENTIQLSFNGNRKSITVSGTDKNSIVACQCRYKKTSDSTYGSYVDILSGVTTSGLNFSYSNNALVNLDANYSWNVQVYIRDKLTSDTLNLIVGQGIPLMSFRNKKVGINVLSPTVALDVGGDIKASGSLTSASASIIGNVSTGTINGWDPTSNYQLRNSLVSSSNTSYSVNDMKGQTRFLYWGSHGVPCTGTTVSFDASSTDNYSFQLNSNYAGASSNSRISFRTRNGDTSTWSQWLQICPRFGYATVGANTSVTYYIPAEFRESTAGDSYLLVLSGNYGSGGIYYMSPNTVTSHTMYITAIKAATYVTITGISDDWGFKITTTDASYRVSVLRLS